MDQTEELQQKIAELEAKLLSTEHELEIMKRAYYLQLRGSVTPILISFVLIGIGLVAVAANHYEWLK